MKHQLLSLISWTVSVSPSQLFCFQPPSRRSLPASEAGSKLRRAWRRRRRAREVCSLGEVAATSPPPSPPPRPPQQLTRGWKRSRWTRESAPARDLGVSLRTLTLRCINTTQQQQLVQPRRTSATHPPTRLILLQRPPNCRPASQVWQKIFTSRRTILSDFRTPWWTLRPVSAAPSEVWLLPSPRIRFSSNLHLRLNSAPIYTWELRLKLKQSQQWFSVIKWSQLEPKHPS